MREAHCTCINGWISGEQSINLSLHIIVGRNDVEEILDDAKIEIDAEGIGRQCNPTACHAVGEHRTDGFWNGILLLMFLEWDSVAHRIKIKRPAHLSIVERLGGF